MWSLRLLKLFLELCNLTVEFLKRCLSLFSDHSLDTELGLKGSNAVLLVRIITCKLLLAGSEGFLGIVRCGSESVIRYKL